MTEPTTFRTGDRVRVRRPDGRGGHATYEGVVTGFDHRALIIDSGDEYPSTCLPLPGMVTKL